MKIKVLLAVFFVLTVVSVHAQVAPLPGLIGNWKFDNNLNDVSGSNFNGSAPNGVSYSTGVVGTVNREGSSALVLNGSNQYVDLGSSAFPTGTHARTISGWAKSNTNGGGYRWIFAYGEAAESHAMIIGMAGKELRGGAYNADLSVSNYWTDDDIAIGKWHHICLTYDGTTATLYADGLYQTSASPVTWDLHPGLAYIGRQINTYGEYWNGAIDDVRIYDRALSASEVQAIAKTPPSVASLTATTASSSQINLSWTDSNNESGYRIERSKGDNTHFGLLTTVSASTTSPVSYSDQNLEAGIKYYYRVLSYNSGGSLIFSNEANQTTSGTVVTAPAGLTANLTSLTTVNLSWTADASTRTGFEIWYATSAGGTYVPLSVPLDPAVRTYSGTFSENTTYYFRVRAVNGSNASAFSNDFTISTSAAPPAAPTGFNAVVSSGTNASLTWTDASTNETGFYILRSDMSGPGTGYTKIYTTVANVTSYLDTDSKTPGTTYYYRVQAFNNGGTSDYTPEKSITTSVGGVVGQWKFNGDAADASGSGYNGVAYYKPSGSWLSYDGTPGKEVPASFFTTGIEGTKALQLNGANQYIDLMNPALLPGGLSARSISAWAKTNSIDSVQRSIATVGTFQTGSNHAMFIGRYGKSLVAGGFGDQDFKVYKKWATGEWHHVCLTYDGSTAKLYFDGNFLISGPKTWSIDKQFAYIGRLFSDFENLWNGSIDDVRIYNKALTASEVQALVTAPPTGAPTGFTATPSWSANVLKWTDNSTNESGFQVERSITSGTGYAPLLPMAPANALSYVDGTAVPGMKYYYRVKAVNAGGNSTYTNEASAAADGIPSGLIVTQLLPSSVSISWVDNSATETGFQIERSTTGLSTDYTPIYTTPSNVTNYEDDNLDIWQTYYYRVTATGINENSPYATVTDPVTTSYNPPSDQGLAWDAAELAALKDLYDNLDGLHWTTKTNWVTNGNWPTATSQVANWYGVTVTNNDITSILLNNNGLKGEMQPSIGDMTQLTALELHQNQLSGSLPNALGNLDKLMYLYLQNNALEGNIPVSLGACSSLRELVLSNNQLTSDPDYGINFNGLQNLNYLGLDHNQFMGPIEDWIGDFPNLWHLRLNDNQFSGDLPASISGLNNLITLIVSNNQLTGTFPSVSSMTQLQNLSAANNKFTNVPAGILGLSQMTMINFDSNELTSIPNFSTQSNKGHLTLIISNNRLDFAGLEPLMGGGITTLTYAPQKNIYDVVHVGYGTSIPLVIPSRNPGLHSTIVWEKQNGASWQNINGTDEDGTLKTFKLTSASSANDGVYRWSMTNSLVTGLTLQSDPITVGNDGGVSDQTEFNALKDLYMSTHGDNWTNHTGWPSSTNWPEFATSAEMANWFGVTIANGDVTGIALDNNHVGPTIPASLGNLTKLQYISFHGNSLSSIPASISNLTQLTYLDLGSNAFEVLPETALNSLVSLVHLDLSENRLLNDYPVNSDLPVLNNLIHLEYLDLSNISSWYQQRSGPIPTWLANMPSLKMLNLSSTSRTRFNGTPDFSALTNLETLNLSFNEGLAGIIPPSIATLTKLKWLDISRCQLTGNIPSEFGNLSNLEYFSCEFNNLGGSLPDAANWTKLKDLNIEVNFFDGVIPLSYSNLNLYTFLANGNSFSGPLPNIRNWTNLQQLGIFGNHFTGAFPSVIGLTNLTFINAALNQFTSIPADMFSLNTSQIDFTSNKISAITGLDQVIASGNVQFAQNFSVGLRNNQLDFSVLEKLKQIGQSHFSSLTPLDPIADIDYVRNTGNPIIITARPTTANTSTILWEKQQSNGTWISVNSSNEDQTQKTFKISSPTSANNGIYRWSMTSTQFAGTTLQSVPITVGDQGEVLDQDEFNALRDFYLSTGGANWSNHTNWPDLYNVTTATMAQIATWYGVTVTNGDVTSLWMDYNNLNGAVPASFSNLTALKQISFRGLDVKPAGIIGLYGSFSTFLSLKNLEYLDLCANKISGELTEEFGQLTHLSFLYLGDNNLSGPLPSNIGNLTNLYFLSLHKNGFTGQLPASFYDLTNLQTLYMYDTKFDGQISESIGKLNKLQKFWAYRSGLQGKLPDALGNCTLLNDLYLYSNTFEGPIPENWKHLVNLQNFWIHFSSISGEVPSWLGDLTGLQSLSIGDNNLTGTMPASLKNIHGLSTLYMERLSLQGGIPDLSALQNLTVADLKFSHLSGNVPSTLMLLPAMQQFILNDNDFTALPNISSRTDKNNLTINIENNQIPIDDIERYFTAPGVHPFKVFTYSPQKNVKLVSRIDIPAGSEFRIDAPSGGVHGTIVWERLVNGAWQNINSLNQSTQPYEFGMANADESMSGTYRYTVTNSWVNMSFASGPITVEVGDALTANEGVTPLYNGTITAVRWHTDKAYQTTDGDYGGTYVYSYDEKYQLKDASWGDTNYALGTVTIAGNKFRTTGMQYDPNGNILALHRYDQNGMQTNNFAYHYQNSSSIVGDVNGGAATALQTNQLKKVDGYVNAYTYNALGQTVGVDKESEEDQYIEYDATGKVTAVYDNECVFKVGNDKCEKNDHIRVEYLYDDRGFRLAKKTYDNNHDLKTTTWYVRDAGGNVLSIYEENNAQEKADNITDHSLITLTEVPLYGAGKLGTHYPEQNQSSVYEITDHLGNVRALLRDNVNMYTATMEDNDQPELTNPRVQENGFFANIFETEKSPTGPWLNHTPENTAIRNTDGSVYHPNIAAYLDGSDERTIGPAITLKTKAGDVFDLKAYGKFRENGSYSSTTALANIISALSGTYVFTPGLESISKAQTVFTSGFAAIGAYGNNDDERPRAFLNYIMFDNQMQYVGSNFDQISADAGFNQGEENTIEFDELNLNVTVPADGYIYIYVSNETPGTVVWFDDLTVTHTGVIVTQTTDYEVWGGVLREQKSDEKTYRFGYQGQFSEKDLETGWSHFELREYDPVIGRWTTTDPYGQYWSPYVGMGNDPVNGTDPDGGCEGGDCLEETLMKAAMASCGCSEPVVTVTDTRIYGMPTPQTFYDEEGYYQATDGNYYYDDIRATGTTVNLWYEGKWVPVYNETQAKARYAADLSAVHDNIGGMNVFLITTALGGFDGNLAGAGGGTSNIFRLTRHGELTNGVYTVSREAMKKHVVGGVTGRSIFYPTLDANEAVLRAAQYADEAGLWIGNKAKVPVLNTNIGTLGNGQPTNIINVYRNSNGFIHGSPGSIR